MPPIKQQMRILSLLLAAALLIGCQTGPVRDLKNTSDTRNLTSEENRSWSAGKKLDSAISKQNILYNDILLTSYIQGIADKLYPEFKNTLTLKLIDSPDLNAFALPNGSIYFNVGLLARLDNESQLATIVAHEVSHFVRQHSLKQRRSTNNVLTAGMAITLLTGIPFSGELLAVSAISGYSQSLETEADELGFERLINNGYDPAEAKKTFEHLLKEVETLEIDQPFFFASHPRLEERIKNFEKLANNSNKKGGLKNDAVYLNKTRQARADILERYLSLHRYKTLILMLEDKENLQRYPSYASYYLGEAYRFRGDKKDIDHAQRAYQKAISAAPEYAPSYRALGILQMKAGENQASLDNLQTYLGLAPKAKDRTYIEQYIKQMRQS